LSPSAAGLPRGVRRRTRGLRREEVAELAGIGTGWYTFLEQGRDVRPSEGAVRRIARALQLDDAEKRYLLNLALESAPRGRGEEAITPVLRNVMSAGIACPAFVVGQRWDLLDYNELANAVFDFEHIPDRNLLRGTFTPEARLFHVYWEQMARQSVATFRARNARLLRDPWILGIIDELERLSPEFRAWWSEQAVSEMYSGHSTYDHPFVGRLQFDYTLLEPADSRNLTLQVCSADGVETEHRLAELVRQARRGEHDEAHNIHTVLAARTHRRAAAG
jgi:transcriptional regulator with XRE-family HTH domain